MEMKKYIKKYAERMMKMHPEWMFGLINNK